MNRAAGELHTVQSKLTARVRQLEDELGVSLFVRHSRGVTLSDGGQRLLSYSTRIDALFHEAIASVKENGVPKGALRIGSLEQTISLRLTRCRFSCREVVTVMAAAITSAEQRIVELGIEMPPAPQPLGSYTETVQSGRLLFVAGTIPTLAGKLQYTGMIGKELDLATGQQAARIAALNALAAAATALGISGPGNAGPQDRGVAG